MYLQHPRLYSNSVPLRNRGSPSRERIHRTDEVSRTTHEARRIYSSVGQTLVIPTALTTYCCSHHNVCEKRIRQQCSGKHGFAESEMIQFRASGQVCGMHQYGTGACKPVSNPPPAPPPLLYPAEPRCTQTGMSVQAYPGPIDIARAFEFTCLRGCKLLCHGRGQQFRVLLFESTVFGRICVRNTEYGDGQQ